MLLAAVDQYVPPAIVDIPYTSHAVHFDGSTYLTRGATLTGWGSPTKWTFAIWTKLSVCNDGPFSDANYFTTGTTTNSGIDYLNINVNSTYFDSAGPISGGGTNANATSIESGSWQGWLASCDPSISRANLYMRDLNVINADVTGFGGTGAIPSNTDFWFGQDGFGVKITGDVADFRLWLGTALDFSVLANRRLFVRSGGGPATPSLANAVLGTPIISFISTGDTSSFSTNGGSGGAFSVTGSLSMAGTSP